MDIIQETVARIGLREGEEIFFAGSAFWKGVRAQVPLWSPAEARWVYEHLAASGALAGYQFVYSVPEKRIFIRKSFTYPFGVGKVINYETFSLDEFLRTRLRLERAVRNRLKNVEKAVQRMRRKGEALAIELFGRDV